MRALMFDDFEGIEEDKEGMVGFVSLLVRRLIGLVLPPDILFGALFTI